MKSNKMLRRILYIQILLMFSLRIQAQNLTPNGTDPTEIRSRIDIVLAQLSNLGTADFLGAAFSGDYAFNSWFSAGAEIPIVYAHLSGRKATGLGDVSIRMLASVYKANEMEFTKAVAAGLEVNLDTRDAGNGTGIGQTIIIPYVCASFEFAEEYLIIPQMKYLFSAKENTNEIDELRLQVDNVFSFSESFWLSVMPEMIIDIKDERLTTYNLQTTLGKI